MDSTLSLVEVAAPTLSPLPDFGKVVAAEVIDHIRLHKDDEALFWEVSNRQSLNNTTMISIWRLRARDHLLNFQVTGLS